MAMLVMFTLVIFNTPLNPDPAVADLGDDYFEDFEGSVFPAWKATGLWHIEDNSTSSWPVYDYLPSNSHYAWYGDNTTGNFDTGDWNYGNLTSDSINLTKLETPIELGFWSWAETENIEGVDIKQIYISPDGGSSWYQLGIIPDSDYEWQYWGFDITDYADSDDVRIRFSFDKDDNIANDYRGWMLDNITIGFPSPRYELLIMQDFSASVGDIKPIDFLAKSYYSYQMDVNISIMMETPSGLETLYETTFYTIEDYGIWDHNIQYEFTEPGDYLVIFNLTDDTGTEWIVDCRWEIEGGYFELWIEQDSTAFVSQEKSMGFYLDSYFSSDTSVNITIVITPPTGYNETLFDKSYVNIGASEIWYVFLSYKFPTSGTYYVNFMVFDEYGTKWDVYCPWYVDAEGFALWIEQDYNAGITDNRKMGFHLDSYFDFTTNFNVSVIMETPSGVNETLYDETYILIEANGYWEYWHNYTFTEAGDYCVYFIVTDDFGEEWVYMCLWEVEEDIFDLWIEQDTYAGVTDWRMMSFHTKSYYSIGVGTNISIDIITPSNDLENLLFVEGAYVESFGHWNHSLEYQFTEAGEYVVIFSIIDEYEMKWARECVWYIEDDFFGTWIKQDVHAIVDETLTIGFLTKSYFDHGMYVDILIEIHTPWDTTEVLLDDSLWIAEYSSWDASIDYTFTETGEYKVFFQVIDEYGDEWTVDCRWKVGEKERFELKIDQGRRADVGDEETMKFMVQSYFSHGMEVEINVTIKTLSGTVEILFNEIVWINEYGTWEESIDYEFNEVGDYKVLFVLIDDIGAEWTEDCEWDISEPDTETTEPTSEGSNPPTIDVTPGFESFLIIGAIAAITIYYRKRHI